MSLLAPKFLSLLILFVARIVLDSYQFFCIFDIFSEMKCFLVKLCSPDIFGKNVISIVMGGSGVTRPRMESVNAGKTTVL